MNHHARLFSGCGAVLLMMVSTSSAQVYRTAAVRPEQVEVGYTQAIHGRADAILDVLQLKDPFKAQQVKAAIVAQYRALRARDAVIDAHFQALGKDISVSNPERSALSEQLTAPLHEMFVGTLSAHLTPAQVDQVKDKLTYNKVQVTFDAYCAIIPKLSDQDKAKILEVLKTAREQAMDGGSADEKHAVFEKYKVRINAYLDSQGHDVEKAFAEWEAKQKALAATSANNDAAPQ